jgi:CubicO group peptidase (beta-lactamase class C family)
MPTAYPDDEAWGDAFVDFASALSQRMQAGGSAVMLNLGIVVSEGDVTRWLRIEDGNAAPDVVVSGAFVVRWGVNDDAQFYPQETWERQLGTFAQLARMRLWIGSHTDLAPGASGVANDGRPVTFEDALWYGLGSYLLVRPDPDPDDGTTMHFSFTGGGGNRLWWFPEYDLDLGRAVSGYAAQTVGDAVVYLREFEQGFVVVNPSTADAAGVALSQPATVLTREILHETSPGPAVDTLDLQAHRAAFLRKGSG